VRGLGRFTLVNRLSAMVFLNIWVRHEYPRPRDRDIVLDLGANVGMFTIFALSHGAQFCHCVEPCPGSVRLLETHLKEFGFRARSHILPAGVGEAAGSGFVSATSNVNNIVGQEKQDGSVEVKVVDVSQLIDSLNPPPTYVKLDIEANEVPVVRRLLSSVCIQSVHTIAIEATKEADTITSMLQNAGFVAQMRSRGAEIIVGTRAVKEHTQARSTQSV
jgi:FkbM family methyltransferase